MMAVPQLSMSPIRGTTQPKKPFSELKECPDCGCWHERDKCQESTVRLLGESDGQRWRRKNRE
jgi:hypothetical protein